MVGLRFENVCLRADVEVLLDGMICQGKVKWKGKIHGSYGNWVGLELRNKVGANNGCYRGIQYFSCADGYGIFVKASQLRFPSSKGRSSSSYRTVTRNSLVDEELFACRNATFDTEDTKSCYIPQVYASNAKQLFPEKLIINERRNYHLGHPISSRVPRNKNDGKGPFCEPTFTDLFATKEQGTLYRKSSTTLLLNTYTKESSRDNSRPFISPPSIPRIHRLPANAWF